MRRCGDAGDFGLDSSGFDCPGGQNGQSRKAEKERARLCQPATPFPFSSEAYSSPTALERRSCYLIGNGVHPPPPPPPPPRTRRVHYAETGGWLAGLRFGAQSTPRPRPKDSSEKAVQLGGCLPTLCQCRRDVKTLGRGRLLQHENHVDRHVRVSKPALDDAPGFNIAKYEIPHLCLHCPAPPPHLHSSMGSILRTSHGDVDGSLRRRCVGQQELACHPFTFRGSPPKRNVRT